MRLPQVCEDCKVGTEVEVKPLSEVISTKMTVKSTGRCCATGKGAVLRMTSCTDNIRCTPKGYIYGIVCALTFAFGASVCGAAVVIIAMVLR